VRETERGKGSKKGDLPGIFIIMELSTSVKRIKTREKEKTLPCVSGVEGDEEKGMVM